MSRVRLLADGLTAFRFCLALYLLWLGAAQGPAALPAAAITLVICWFTDLADGPLSRLDKEGTSSWIGRRDLEVDSSVGIGVLGYLTISRYFPWLVGLGYLVLAAALVWHFRSVHLAWAFQAPPYMSLIYLALRDALPQGVVMIAWIVFTLVVTWPRFPETTLPTFFKGMNFDG